MHQDEDPCRQQGQLRTQPDQEGQDAQGRDGGVGQDALEVGAKEGLTRPIKHGEAPYQGEGIVPGPVAAQQRRKPKQHVDPRLDHGGRVQVGRHRRRGLHRGGQPVVEGELG